MAKYTGSISLVDVSDMISTSGVGISHSEVLYAVSNTNSTPPDLEKATLTTIDGNILNFAEIDSNFYIADNILYAQQNGNQVMLEVNNNLITGIDGWCTEIPEVKPGLYLWTKTIFYYTNDEQTVTYTVSKQGEDGEQGPPGTPSSGSFRSEDCP